MIVVFGSINADIFFSFEKLPRPGETVLTDGYSLRPGGKGANQAVSAARDGADVRFVGAVGRDPNASSVHVIDGVTGTAVIAVEASGENQILVASGANTKVSAKWLRDDLLTLQTTLLLQMELPQAETEAAIRKARAKGCRVILNDAPFRPLSREVLADVDILIANEEEAMGLLGGGPDLEKADLARGLARLCRGTGIVTIGAAGVVAAHAGGCFKVPALPITPVDAVRRAVAASGVICTLPGAQSPELNEGRINAALADLPSVTHI